MGELVDLVLGLRLLALELVVGELVDLDTFHDLDVDLVGLGSPSRIYSLARVPFGSPFPPERRQFCILLRFRLLLFPL